MNRDCFSCVFIFSVVLVFFGCDPATKTTAKANLSSDKAVQEVGKKSAKTLLTTLKKNLVEQIQKNGTVAAMEFCSEKALKITSEVESKLEEGIKIERVTSRPRNPANAPDDSEKKALEYFQEKWSEKPPMYLVDNEKNYHFYKPLAIGGECLQCHGLKENLSTEVKDFLTKKHPEDQATGYKLNDFRGVVKVTIPKK